MRGEAWWVEGRTRLSLEEMFRLKGGNVRDGSKDIRTMSSRSLNAVSVCQEGPLDYLLEGVG